ncbi:aminodeoxychorismate/anthranilate synthase component II [Adhaeribacter swui]|uniref:Aminodeoxychorismate/anthranilate synthase component II n=1 Tax=Adhaeribacter swui TaxID=2086471 RepID=A0A7G7G7X5_9BACT|nr:aminodeoxychorismate/anthranilate synthase component II [Adhaeribacter swui]QNF33259.1 aminodeoxychorismate/anthranilate synthase component II [Adhaeribacter swui]
MILLLDSFDSFTYNLLDYFGQLSVSAQVVRNNVALAEIQALDFEAIVLSPGPGKPREAGVLMEVIAYYHDKLPILGICLGHQALGEFFGATLVKGIKPMHGKVSEITCVPDPVFAGLPTKMPVVRYHSLVLQEPGKYMVPLAYTAAGELMAFRHELLPLYALQFHPEAALTTYGLDILRNWLTIAGIRN